MKILFLHKRPLFPADAGGKIRTLNVVRHLAQWHDVTYLCNAQPADEPHLDKMRELGVRLVTTPWREAPRRSFRFYCDLAKNVFSRFPFNVNKDYDAGLRQRAGELLQAEPYDLVICDFVQMARNAIDLPASPPALLFQHNVEAEIFKRHSTTDRGWLRRRYMAMQWRKMCRFEGRAGRRFDRIVAVSERDRDIYQCDYGWDHVDVIDTAVDVDYFAPAETKEKPNQVVFVGSLDWLPNEGGVKHFVEQVWPLIRRDCPEATFQAVGRNPSHLLTRLSSHEGVEIVGTVPDVRPYLAEAAVVVVPLLVGGGTRLKIFEAMAMRKAVVSTSIGAEGLPVRSGTDIEIADNPEEFAAAVTNLLTDSARRVKMAQQAFELVHERFTSTQIARQFEAICQTTAFSDGRPSRPTTTSKGSTA